MKRIGVLVLALAGVLAGQIVVINNEPFASARTKVNNNFSWLNSQLGLVLPAMAGNQGKVLSNDGLTAFWDNNPPTAPAAPAACNEGAQYYDTTGHTTNECRATNTWVPFAGTLYTTYANTANNMLSTDGGTYNGLVSINACPGGVCGFTAVNMGYVIPANTLTEGKMIKVGYYGVFTVPAVSTGHNMQLTMNGGTPVFTGASNLSPAINSTNAQWFVEFLVVGTAAPGAAVAVGVSLNAGSTFGAGGRNTLAPVSVATNADLAIGFSFKFQASPPTGNMIQVRGMYVQVMN